MCATIHRSGSTGVPKSVAKWRRHARIHPRRGTGEPNAVAQAMGGGRCMPGSTQVVGPVNPTPWHSAACPDSPKSRDR